MLVGDGNRDTHRIYRAKESKREQMRARYHALSYTDRYENMEWGQLSHLPPHRRPVLERSLGEPSREGSETEEEGLRRMVSPFVIEALSGKYTRVQSELSSQVFEYASVNTSVLVSFAPVSGLFWQVTYLRYTYVFVGVRGLRCVCLARERGACVAALVALCCVVIHSTHTLTHTHTHTHTCLCVCTGMHVVASVCMCMCVCLCAHTCISFNCFTELIKDIGNNQMVFFFNFFP